MTFDELRVAGHQLIDWIADYRQVLDEMPVRAHVEALWQLIQDTVKGSPEK